MVLKTQIMTLVYLKRHISVTSKQELQTSGNSSEATTRLNVND